MTALHFCIVCHSTYNLFFWHPIFIYTHRALLWKHPCPPCLLCCYSSQPSQNSIFFQPPLCSSLVSVTHNFSSGNHNSICLSFPAFMFLPSLLCSLSEEGMGWGGSGEGLPDFSESCESVVGKSQLWQPRKSGCCYDLYDMRVARWLDISCCLRWFVCLVFTLHGQW